MKKYIALLIIPPLMVAGIFFYFFFRLGTNDAKALADFTVAYKEYDNAISDYSMAVFASNPAGSPGMDDLERKTGEALVDLNTKASARISSLTKNDADLMSITLEIADLSGKELDTLTAYKRAIADKNVDTDKLAKEFGDLTNKRKAAYAHFQELARL